MQRRDGARRVLGVREEYDSIDEESERDDRDHQGYDFRCSRKSRPKEQMLRSSRSYEYAISLRLRGHPSIDPRLISRELRMRPHVAWRAGDRRVTPTGDPLEGFREVSYWSKTLSPRRTWIRAEVGSAAIAERRIEKLLERLRSHAAFFRRFRRERRSAEIWISSYSKRNYPLEIEPRLAKLLAQLRVTLIIDIYPYRQRGCR